MEREHVLSENRRLLIRYLAEIGCGKPAVWQIAMIDLEEETQVLQMLQFCKENHPNLSEAKLLEVSSKISLRYGNHKELYSKKE